MLDWLTKGLEGPLTALLAICAVAGVVVLLRRWQHRVGEDRRLTTESRAERREADDVRRSLEALLTEVERATQQLDERIDTRLRALEEVESRVATRINALQELETRFDRQRIAATSAVAPTTHSPQPGSAPVMPPRSPTPIVARASKSAVTDERHRAVYDLAEAGVSAAAIAEQRGLPLGEVELILGLRRLALTTD